MNAYYLRALIEYWKRIVDSAKNHTLSEGKNLFSYTAARDTMLIAQARIELARAYAKRQENGL